MASRRAHPPGATTVGARAGAAHPVGMITRGTTNPNRLRRIDRFLTGPLAPVLRGAADPLVVDLGYGATPVTTMELSARLRAVRGDVQVVGLEIDPARVAAGRTVVHRQPVPGVQFERGGFELGSPALDGRRVCLVRAANVLRQYPEAEVASAWATVAPRLSPGGMLVDATCNEVGRVASWVCVNDAAQPVSFTISLRLAGLERPGVVAERLPKALIHRNVAGEWIHDWLAALDDAWTRAVDVADFGVRQRFLRTVEQITDAGWPMLDGPTRWRLGEVTLAWPTAT